MPQGLLVRLRPVGPWRFGPGDGALDRVDALYRSDRLYSALTLAMQQLGHMEEWLDATAQAERPAVVLSSLFPFQTDTLFAPPPASLWPPPSSLVTTPSPVFLTKVRWRAARFVPLPVLEALLTGQSILADQWAPDAESGCLLRRDRPSSSPFRVVQRNRAPVDRMTGRSEQAERVACVEFEPGAGLWTAIRFSGASAETAWTERVQAAFRLLADTGFGARRSSGWGQTAPPEFQTGAWPQLLIPKLKPSRNGAGDASSRLYWLLSLYSPAASDSVDWSGGFYEVTVRGGRVESPAASGAAKKQARLIAEGSVLAASSDLIGAAVDVAPDGFAHPVYRSGLALAIALPTIEPKAELRAEEPSAVTAFDNVEEAVREDEPTPPQQEPEEEPEPVREPIETPPIEEPEPEEPEPAIEPVIEPIPEAGDDPQPSVLLEPSEPVAQEEGPVEPIPEAGGDPQPTSEAEESSFEI
jgi:CRISPR type III-A-associated RAMP protein Csm4